METLQDVKMSVYKFGNKTADGNTSMKNLLGGKGANLAEMSLLGIPVPAGFTITTEVCTKYNEVGQEETVAMIRNDVKKPSLMLKALWALLLVIKKTLC